MNNATGSKTERTHMKAEKQTNLLQALNLWREITGIDPTATSLRLADWHLRETFDELQEAVALDPTEITANLLLAYFANAYLGNREVSLLDLLNQPSKIEAQLEKPRELLAILNRPEVVESRESFVAALNAALRRYEAAEREDVQKLLAQPDDVAILRRDALRSIARLRVDQFLDGSAEPADFRPVYNRTVHQWWNINSMLASATRMPSGVSLNLVRHPDAFQSYFCFTIRNGGNLFVLTDVPEYSHPLEAFMSRRPDRTLSKRAAKNWFPYDLLGLEYDEESKRLYIKESEQRGLVAYQNAALPLKPIAELPAAELVWVSMMFDLIVEKFWRRDFKAPAFSYTAEMLKSETALIELARTANLPVQAYQPAGLPALTKADVLTGATTEEEVGRKYHEPNRWIEERYGDQVPDAMLNLVAAPEQIFALEGKSGEITTVDPSFLAMTEWQQQDELTGRKKLEKVDATSFGSREQIQADRKFIARVNFARHVHALAKQEYLVRNAEVAGWYREHVAANAAMLLRWAGNTDLWIDDGIRGTFSGYAGSVGPVRYNRRNFVERYEVGSDDYRYRFAGCTPLGQTSEGGPLCFLNGTRSSFWVVYAPATPYEIALLAGCGVGDLPDVLRHWSRLRPYTGNAILDRIDPMLWEARNPWLKQDFRVLIGFSKRGMAKIDKQPALKPPLVGLMDTAPTDQCDE